MTTVIPRSPPGILAKDMTREEQVMKEPQGVFFLDERVFPGGVELPEEGGVFVHKVGGELVEENGQYKLVNPVPLLYPEKGFPDPAFIGSNNLAKRFLMSTVALMAQNAYLLIPLVFLPFRWKVKVLASFLESYRSFAFQVLEPYFLQDHRYSAPSRELGVFVAEFLRSLGIEGFLAIRFAKCVAHNIEYDTAYRWRIEDILSETTQEKVLKHPRKEVRRLLSIFQKREPRVHLVKKFGYFATLFSWILLHPKIKRAFREAISSIDFSKVQLDDADRYHVLKYSGYDFLGMPIEQRFAIYNNMHHGNPPKMVMIKGA